LIETLSNDPRCVGGECGSFINSLIDGLSRVTYFPIPDVEIYESVKDLINRGGIPFESSVDIDENIYRELKEIHNYVLSSEIYEILYDIDIYNVDQNMLSKIDFEYDRFRVVFKSKSPYNIIGIGFDIDPNKPKIYVSIDYIELTGNIDRVVDVIRNWYIYVSKTIVYAIKWIEKLDNIDQDTSNQLKNYLETWLKVITIYRNDIEKNKKF
ncbi:MAG: hypothetical protein QW456_11995, partial [Ignisphaera sp.]